ncbi:MAG: amidohydrolase [Gemmatimonadetes bacterium]|nr:MAG: amidohydrolase [Gemmatimonadota bacterium]
MVLLAFLTLQQADLVVTNAQIYTSDVNRPVVEALVVRAGRIAFVGSNRGALALAGPRTERLDLAGKTVITGMVDAHAHLLGLGQALRTVDLVGTRSYDEVIARVVERAKTARPGEWIRGRGWDQNDWADTRFPTHAALSRAVPNNPVYLTRVDGHAALVNAKALELAQVTAATPDPSGGRFIRDSANNPTGVLVDNAQGIVGRVIPVPSRAELKEQTLAAIAEANRWGLTGIHDAGVAPEGIAVYEELAKEGRYNLRNYVMVRSSDSVLDAFMQRGPQKALYDGRLWIRAIKLVADGALGSRGAALLEPYSDDPGNTGLITTPPERIKSVAVRALKAGFQLNVHAIGDRANRIVLDQFEAALREVPTADHRFRIEHAQILRYQDIPRFAELDVIPSMQGSHQTSDMYWVPNRLGWARAQGAYAWRSLLNTGVVIPNGSDFPVEAVNPLISFHSFFTRQDADNFPPGGWMPEQRTTRQEALLSITLWPAYAAFMENESGSLTAGKYADFVVLDRDIMAVAPEAVLGTHVLLTVLGGKAVYRANSN